MATGKDLSLEPGGNLADEALMENYLAGDLEGLRGLFVRHARRLQAFFWCMSGSAAQAEELSQKTWLRLHRQRKNFERTQGFAPFLYGLAVQVRRDQVQGGVVRASQPGVSRLVKSAATLVRVLADLPDSYREVLVLERLLGLRTVEVARALGATEDAVKQRAQQGETQLAELALRAQEDLPLFDAALFDAAIEPKPLEQSARALLPIAARDLAPLRIPFRFVVAFLFLATVAAVFSLRLFR